MYKTLVAVASLAAACAHADLMYTLPAGSQYSANDSNYSVSGFVDFFLNGCSAGGANCTLDVEIENTQAGTEVANQAISGVTFELSNAGTALTVNGGAALSSVITSKVAHGQVTTIAQSDGALGTTNSAGNWKLQYHPTDSPTWGSGAGAANFTIDNHPGGKTALGMIVTASAGGSGAPGTDSSFSPFSPSLMGPVYFQVVGISGLTASTDISNISILFGDAGIDSSPTGYLTFTLADCTASGPGNCSTGQLGYGPAVPEPVSFLLAGSGLLALACLTRRAPPA